MSDPRVATRGGWMKIVKNFWEAMLLAKFTPNERALLGMLILKTWGANPKRNSCKWSIRTAADITYMSKKAAEIAWKNLRDKNTVICHREQKSSTPGEWGPNEEFWTWEKMPDKFSIFLDKVAGSVSPLVGDAEKTSKGDTGQKVTHAKGDAYLQKRGRIMPKKGTHNAKKGDALTPDNDFAEAIVDGSQEREREREYKESGSCISAALQTVSSYDYRAHDKSEHADACRLFLKFSNGLVSNTFALGTIVPKLRAKIIDVIETPVPGGIPAKAWWRILAATFKQVMDSAKDMRAKGKISEPISFGISQWRAAISFAVDEYREMPPAPSSPPVTRKRDRRFVVEPPRMNLPIMGSWRACYADEITDDDRARFLREEAECQEALIAWKARQAEIEAQNPKPERRKRQ